MFVFSIFTMTVYPVVIMPMFNKYDPLLEGSLKTNIYALANQVKYPLTNLFVMDGELTLSINSVLIQQMEQYLYFTFVIIFINFIYFQSIQDPKGHLTQMPSCLVMGRTSALFYLIPY